MAFQNYNDLAPYLKDFIEGEGAGQRANFFSRFTPRNANESRFGSNQFQNYIDRYAGALGAQARSGQDPNLSWTDFLDQNMNFQRDLLRGSPEQTGRFTSRLAGPARWLTQR